MKTREKFEGTDMADLMWGVVEKSLDLPKFEAPIHGNIYWEDCLELADMLHRKGYRLVAEPESNDIIKGVVLEG